MPADMFDTRERSHGFVDMHSQNLSIDELVEFLKTAHAIKKPAAIYVHIPFCDNICSFCSMNRTRLDGELDEYVLYLLKWIKKYSLLRYIKDKKISTIYFGGGTPSILKPEHMAQILTALKDSFDLTKDCEISFESTLHNLSMKKLDLMSSLGVNRLSIGIQTFSSKGRELLNRIYTKQGAIKKLKQIKSDFCGTLCTDIIYNYPNQSINEAIQDARILRDIGVDSSSFYSMQLHQNSLLKDKISPAYYDLARDKALHHAFVGELLSGGGYEFMEYTKIRKIGKDNYTYIALTHSGADIIPLGVGSGGHIGEFGVFHASKERVIVSKKSELFFKLSRLNSLFQYKEISLSEVENLVDKQSFVNLMEFFKECAKYGYLQIQGGRLSFSLDGVFWGNSVAKRVLEIVKEGVR